MRTACLLFTAAIVGLGSFPAVSRADRNVLYSVHFQEIKLRGFWKQQTKRLTEKWLPHCIKQMEAGGAGQELLNLVHTAKVIRGESHGEYTGAPWSDAYVYNTMESICLALAIDPDGDAELAQVQSDLRAKMKEWIPIILAAQLPSGYIHSFHTVNGHPHFSNIAWHEFYVMGYFLEMGVAHYRITGGEDRRLYDAAVRCADHLDSIFGPPPKRTWKNGHAGLEYALCRLGQLVDEVEGAGAGDRYVRLAKHFLDHQHEIEPNPYDQSNKPAVEMTEAEGHAVRATYFYTAMADMALLLDDQAYRDAVDEIWDNALHRKHYLTGGVGASHNGEAFSRDFDLRNDGYCESCAGCGLSFWSDRMHRLHHDAHYRDVQERVLYNNLLGAIELSGENFFYQNPLTSDGARYPWHGCPCCVGNIPRALLAIKDLMYSVNAERNTLYLSHFVDSEATIPDVVGTSLGMRQETSYPWKDEVKITLSPSSATAFTLNIRIPNRTESGLYTATPDVSGRFTLSVNGEPQSLPVEKGYVSLERTWQAGDTVTLSLPLEVQRVHCDQRVLANCGRVALQRGPLTYSFEDVDHTDPVDELILKPTVVFEPVWHADLLDGVVAIEGAGLRAIPNFARLNRGGGSQVWVIQDPEKLVDIPSADEASLPPPVLRPDLDPRTADKVQVGRAKSEREHHLRGEDTGSGVFSNRVWRHAWSGGWFSYQLVVKPDAPQTLHVTYWGDETGSRRFDILVDGTNIGSQVLFKNHPGEFFDVEYPIPEELTHGKQKVTVRFQAEANATAGGIFDLRILEVRP
ncbi:MAG: glycoside hydrolase family 127 protein [Pirellulaceae bacterium]